MVIFETWFFVLSVKWAQIKFMSNSHHLFFKDETFAKCQVYQRFCGAVAWNGLKTFFLFCQFFILSFFRMIFSFLWERKTGDLHSMPCFKIVELYRSYLLFAWFDPFTAWCSLKGLKYLKKPAAWSMYDLLVDTRY